MVDLCIRVMALVGHHTIFHPHAGVQPCVKAFVGECVVCPIHGQSVKNCRVDRPTVLSYIVLSRNLCCIVL